MDAPHVIERLERNRDIERVYRLYDGDVPYEMYRELALKHKCDNRIIKRQILQLGYPEGAPCSVTKYARLSVRERDNNTCQYCCSTENIKIDHVIPQACGGLHYENNLVCACDSCNYGKSTRLWVPRNIDTLVAEGFGDYDYLIENAEKDCR